MNVLYPHLLPLNGIYTSEYFLTDCEGYTQYLSSKGRYLSPRLKKIFTLANILPDMRVLDIGCGRGELILHSANCNASGIGIDSSWNALTIAKETLNHWLRKSYNLKNRVCFINTNSFLLPFKSDTFDVVFLSDIVEHLDIKDLEKTLFAIYEVLKPKGKIVLHSSPNRIFTQYGLKLYFLLGRLYNKKLGWNMRKHLPQGCQSNIHVNEHTIFSLRKIFRKTGFKNITLWLEKNPHYIYYFFGEDSFVRKVNFLRKILPFKHLFYSDIYGIVSK